MSDQLTKADGAVFIAHPRKTIIGWEASYTLYRDVRLPVMVTQTEAEAIDRWRYANQVPSRSEAIRRLIEIGLRWEVAAASKPGE